MSKKRCNGLVPVMMEDIVAGQIYIVIGVCVGELYFEHFVFHGRPFKIDDEWVMMSRDLHSAPLLSPKMISGMTGLGCGYETYRTFRYTLRNEQVLRSLAERAVKLDPSATDEYLALIT